MSTAAWSDGHERIAVQLTPRMQGGDFIELLRTKQKNPKLRIDNVQATRLR